MKIFYMRVLCSFLFLMISSIALAQGKNTFVVPPGEVVSNVVTNSQAYKYPEFQKGTVVFHNGNTATSKLNHHALFNEMHFISLKRDTLAVNSEELINFIAIGKDTFYHNEGFIQVVASNKDIKLAKRELITLAETQKNTGAYGNVSSAAVESVNAVASRALFKTLVASSRMIFGYETTYYFRDKYNHIAPANKQNLLKMYHRKKKVIDQYLDQNPVNFKKEEDLIRLMNFLDGV